MTPELSPRSRGPCPGRDLCPEGGWAPPPPGSPGGGALGQGRGRGLRGTPRRLPARRWGSALRAPRSRAWFWLNPEARRPCRPQAWRAGARSRQEEEGPRSSRVSTASSDAPCSCLLRGVRRTARPWARLSQRPVVMSPGSVFPAQAASGPACDSASVGVDASEPAACRPREGAPGPGAARAGASGCAPLVCAIHREMVPVDTRDVVSPASATGLAAGARASGPLREPLDTGR